MDDLKLIKKYYGEAMSHLARELFPTILENKGLLFSLLSSNTSVPSYGIVERSSVVNAIKLIKFKLVQF